MSGGGGGGQQTTTTVQKADPWAGQQPYLTDIFQQAQQKYYSQQPQYYPGQTVAPQSQNVTNAQNYMTNLANNQLPQYANNTLQASNFALNAPDINNNPAFQGAVRAAIDPAVRGFQTAIMPTIRSDFGGAGENYGSSRRGIATGLASEALANNVFKTAATMGNEAYGQGLTAQGRALALGPQTLQTLQAPGNTLDVVGQQQEQYQQDLINAEIQKWNFGQTAPWQALAQYQNMVQGNYGGQSSGETTAPGPRSNRAMSAIGGAAAGASIGSMIMPGIGTGIGALAGLLFGGFM